MIPLMYHIAALQAYKDRLHRSHVREACARTKKTAGTTGRLMPRPPMGGAAHGVNASGRQSLRDACLDLFQFGRQAVAKLVEQFVMQRQLGLPCIDLD